MAGRGQPSTSSLSELQIGGSAESLSLSLDQNLEQELTAVRRIARQKANIKQRAHMQEQECLKVFVDQQQPTLRERLIETHPQLAPWREWLHPVPDHKLAIFDFAKDAVPITKKMATWCLSSSRTCNLKKVLEDNWSRKNSPVTHNPANLPNTGSSATKPCLRYGQCCCSFRGKESFHFKNQLLASIKARVSRTHEEQKQALMEGFLVLRLRQTEELPPRGQGWRELVQEELDPSSAPTAPRVLIPEDGLWLHIALQYLSPYRPTFHVLRRIGGPELPECWLEQTGEVLSDMELASRVDLQYKYSFEIHKLISTAAPVTTLQPSRCLVRLFVEGDYEFYTGPKKRTRRSCKPASRRAKAKTAPSARRPSPSSSVSRPDADLGPNLEDVDAGSSSDSSQLSDEALKEDEQLGSQHGSLSPLDVLFDEHLQSLQEQPQEDVVEQEQEELDEVLLELFGPGQSEEPLLHEDPVEDFFNDLLEDDSASEPAADAVPEDLPRDAQPEEEPPAMPAHPPPQLRVRSDLVCEVPGGRIMYYHTKNLFTATCSQPGHGQCVLTRSAGAGRRAAQGRPLGLLASWLAAGARHATKAEHWDRSQWPSHEQRSTHRDLLAENPLGLQLLQEERPQEAGEAAEPDDVP